MNTIITICTVLSMYMTSLHDINSEYYYNADIDNGIVKTMYVYDKVSNGISPKLSYDFKYDAEGRLIEKTVNIWDSWSKQYKPSFRLEMSYYDNSYEVALSLWNKHKKEWKTSSEKIIYQIENDQVTTVNYLQRNHQGEYDPIDCMSILDPSEGLLLAETW